MPTRAQAEDEVQLAIGCEEAIDARELEGKRGWELDGRWEMFELHFGFRQSNLVRGAGPTVHKSKILFA
jgi:hypothetical protein